MTPTARVFVDTAAWADLVLGDAENHAAIEDNYMQLLANRGWSEGMRTLYLTSAISLESRDNLTGRMLYDRFSSLSDASLLGHLILPTKDEEGAKDMRSVLEQPAFADDILKEDDVRAFAPDFIYFEGGLFSGLNTGQLWKMPRRLLRDLMGRGAVVIIADADTNLLRRQKRLYSDASDLIGAHANYGRHVSQVYADYGSPSDETTDGPVDIVDQSHHGSGGIHEIICRPNSMITSDWLHPVYEDITEIGVWGAVSVTPTRSDVLASGNRETAGTLCDDVWVYEHDPAPFATVARTGKGYAVFIAASVSHDGWSRDHPDNVKWLMNISTFLVTNVVEDRARYKRPETIGAKVEDDASPGSLPREQVVKGLRDVWPDTEKNLRRFIETIMQNTYGEQWVDVLVKRNSQLKNMFDGCRKKQQGAVTKARDRAPSSLINYTYPADLFTIMFAEWSLFQPILGEDKAYWNERSRLLSRARTPLQHSRDEELHDHEVHIAHGYCKEILHRLHAYDQKPID